MEYNLDFIKKDNLTTICQEIIDKLKTLETEQETDASFYKNLVDPFSAIFEASFHDISLTKWKKMELSRQFQKTLQNEIGLFHQKVIGKITGWEDLGTGKIVDLKNVTKKIFAEIKNKYNTTKGNNKTSIYDDLLTVLNHESDKDYTGYYVEILALKKQNVSFRPSDNTITDQAEKNRPNNPRIRIIDGASFYEIATGDPVALEKIYKILPYIIAEIINIQPEKIVSDKLFGELFTKIPK